MRLRAVVTIDYELQDPLAGVMPDNTVVFHVESYYLSKNPQAVIKLLELYPYEVNVREQA